MRSKRPKPIKALWNELHVNAGPWSWTGCTQRSARREQEQHIASSEGNEGGGKINAYILG